jgi:hypothetical protein
VKVEVEYLYVYCNNKKKALNFDRLIFVSVFFIFATIFHTITPDLVFSSGIDDHVLDSTDTQNKSPNDTKRVALIQNKFTYAAYQNGSIIFTTCIALACMIGLVMDLILL